MSSPYVYSPPKLRTRNINITVSLAVGDAGIMHGLVALAALRRQSLQPTVSSTRDFGGKVGPSEALNHLGQALQLLQNKIRNRSATVEIVTIVLCGMLLVPTIMQGDEGARKAHHQGLATMVRLAGGINSLPSHLACQISRVSLRPTS